MNPERHELIEKRANGTLTTAEYRQYLTLLQTDPTFHDDIALYQLLSDTDDASNASWDLTEEEPADEDERPPVSPVAEWGRRYPLWSSLAVAASLVLLLGLVWLVQRSRIPSGPQLVKIETNYLFRPAGQSKSGNGQGYVSGDVPVGELPVKWVADAQLAQPLAYIYCRDTLTFFIRNSRDTTQLGPARLEFDAVARSLSLRRPNRPVTSFRPCTPAPQPF